MRMKSDGDVEKWDATSPDRRKSQMQDSEKTGAALHAYGISPHVLQASIPAIASMAHANSLSPNDFTRSFIVNLL